MREETLDRILEQVHRARNLDFTGYRRSMLHRALAAAAARMQSGVFATDIDGEALAAARAATYQPDRLRFVRPELLDRYFARQGGRYAVSAEVREMVRFSRDDLTSPSSGTPRESVYGDFHLVFCRNVLMYQSRALQNRVLDKLCAAVATGGFLVLGGSEYLLGSAESRFQEIRAGSRVYARREPG